MPVERPSKWDRESISKELEQQGYALLPGLIEPMECDRIRALYLDDSLFRAKVVMQRHAYGRGQYRYFAYPLPHTVDVLRRELYENAAPIANDWARLLGLETSYPTTHSAYLERCHAAGQTRPTPLLLSYGAGDFNRLHQDLYGHQVFPLQVAILLSTPGEDFTGGEFLLSEHRARMQTRAEVVPLGKGDGVLFPVALRPIEGVRGPVRAQMRHGVSRIRTGQRMTLGIIFHDAT